MYRTIYFLFASKLKSWNIPFSYKVWFWGVRKANGAEVLQILNFTSNKKSAAVSTLSNFDIVIVFILRHLPTHLSMFRFRHKKQGNDMGGVYSGNCNMTVNARNWIIDAWKAWALFIIECNKLGVFLFLKEIKKEHRQKNYIWFEKCDKL